MASTEALVTARREQLQTRLSEQRALLAHMEAELADIETALRVLANIEERDAMLVLPQERASFALVAERKAPVKRKPDHVPPMADMILASIRGAARNGIRGQRPKEMVDYIRRHHWDGASLASVGPIAARMFKDDRLSKDEKTKRYLLPENEAPAVSAADASEHDFGAGYVDIE